MTNEDIAMQLISLYASASMRNCSTADHKRAVANAVLRLGYVWEDDLKLEEPK